jgi:uncharacterized protein (TIGR02118 family)
MLKVVVLLCRRDGMSREEFERHWRERHLPLVAKIPGLRRLVLNRVLPDPNGSQPAFDAVVEDWFDDRQALSAAAASPEWQAVVADAPNSLDMARFQLLVVEEVPLPAGTPGAMVG